jgi:hypothetical protein
MPPGHGRLFNLRNAAFFALVVVFFFGSAGIADAGFGITPPYVYNQRLTRGSVYEQQITLVRSDPVDDLKVEISMNIPGIETWFSVDRGRDFVFPKGTTQLPVIFKVTVPEDAEYKPYKGAIRIRTSSMGSAQPGGGAVSIALGAQVDVDITVVDKIYDFEVRKIRITGLEEGRTRWGLFFPAKIKFFITIQNTGNADFGPTKVRFDIYDSEGETLLESVENTNTLEQIPPFAEKEIVAELPTRLPPGRYTVKYTIFKNDDIAQQNELTLSINPLGTVEGYEGYGFMGLSNSDKLKAVGVAGTPVVLAAVLIAILVSRRNRRRRMRKIYPRTTQLR